MRKRKGYKMLTESVHVRLSDAEREAVARLPAAEGRSRSNWIRRVLLAEMARKHNAISSDPPLTSRVRHTGETSNC